MAATGSRRVGDDFSIDILSTVMTSSGSISKQIHYVNSLSSREMDSLTAACDTILPSIQLPGDPDHPLNVFYRTSASMSAIHESAGEFLSGRLQHTALWLLRVALWFLSTWYGTFFICGRASLSSHFPYFQKFSKVLPHKREEILLSLSFSSFYLYRMFFKALKYLAALLYFTQVDEKNGNPAWKALDYCGPDPDFIKLKEQEQEEEEGGEDDERRVGPLCKAVMHLDNHEDMVSNALHKAGFPISIGGGKTSRGRKTSSSLTISCDVVVVGSGSGGGVVAGALAKAGYSVLVLEKGNYYARRNLSLLEGQSMEKMYEGGGLLATDDLGVVVLSGSAVGGGSAVNWSASIRTPSHVANEWCEKQGLELFRSKMYKEALDVVCERMGVQSELGEEGFNNAVLRKGCLELGYPVNNIPRNSSVDHHCGWCCFGCKDGQKKGTNETWLVDLAKSGRGAILSGCKALKVLHEKKNGRTTRTATGVVFEHGGAGRRTRRRVRYVVDSKVTVVSCGALGTPTLLKRSGLKNPNIGKHLHLHPVVMAWGYFPTNNPSSPSWPNSEKKSYEGSIMTSMSTVVANFDSSGYGAVIQTPALHPGMFSVVTPWVSGRDFKDRMIRYPRTAHIFALARDQGTGEVNLPMSLKYSLDPKDEQNLNRGVEKMLRILVAAGAEEVGTHHCKGERLNVKTASSHEFERFVKKVSSRPLRDLSTPIYSAHQMGSCRMGVDEGRSVVKETGETWEVEGLFIADTSVFPTALGVNPMVTVQAIAYCTAQSVINVLLRKKLSK
ncbi:long-chain-alcohol oxidase FAO4A-like [Aristolochia californica]|uniref:long-chain-alcohol oxidase FAO4A-like n=1 Tax=Aristolochia californica TaxID=171875 RepID=UPI0035E087FA